MKFIGHLDVMRYFQKAMRRADVDICYSGGFSPHQIMSFAAPLGVGITSRGEYFDIEVSSTLDSAQMLHRLNETMAEGFEVIQYRLLPDTAAVAMSIVAAADYTLTFRQGYGPADEGVWFAGLCRFFERPEILVMKKTKKGERELDLKPLVYKLCRCRTEREGREQEALLLRISAGSVANIKPELLLDAYYAFLQEERPPFAFCVQREEVYADRALPEVQEGGVHGFIPLGVVGRDLMPGELL